MKLNDLQLKNSVDAIEVARLMTKAGNSRIDILRKIIPTLHPNAVETSPGIWMTEELYNEMQTEGI